MAADFFGLRKNNMEQPLVSVVTVVFNDVHHLERTILSVLNQTYKNIEYIIIDGGSTDGTVEVIKKYADRLAYSVSEKDGGIFDAMNKGMLKAKGEWLNIMNSGDYFFSNTVFEEIFTRDHSQSDLLYGNFIGNFNGRPALCTAFEHVEKRSWKGMSLGHQAMFIRTEIMRKHPFDLQYRHSADGELVTYTSAQGYTFERLPQVIFRVGTLGNSFKNWLPARMENWKIARRYFPGLKTELYHFQGIARELIFRFFKKITSWIGLYQLTRYIYHRLFMKKISLLPKNSQPYDG